jgi:hypothetical protein
MKYEIAINGAKRQVDFAAQANKTSRVNFTVDDRVVEACAVRISPGTYSILIGGRSLEVTAEEISGGLLVRVHGREFHAEIIDPRSWRRRGGAGVEL